MNKKKPHFTEGFTWEQNERRPAYMDWSVIVNHNLKTYAAKNI